jgi:hypothetical protein
MVEYIVLGFAFTSVCNSPHALYTYPVRCPECAALRVLANFCVCVAQQCPRVYHHDCLDKESNDKLKKVKRWFCPHCVERGVNHGTHRPKIAGQRPPIQHDSQTIETLARIGDLCRSKLPEGHFMCASPAQPTRRERNARLPETAFCILYH